MKYIGKGLATIGIWLGATLMLAICAICFVAPLLFLGGPILVGTVTATRLVWQNRN